MSSLVERPHQFFIGGRWVDPSSDAQFLVRDSASEEPFLSFAMANPDDIGRAIAAAREAFDKGPWTRMSHVERAGYLKAIAAGFMRRSEAVAELWIRESGAVMSIARSLAAGVAATFDYYAGLAETFPFIEQHDPGVGNGNYGLLVREPVGVVAAIVPWNGPAALNAIKCAPALLAGCTVIVKASPEAPGAAWMLAEICQEAGLPAGVVNVVMADRDVSELLVRDARVDKISFTGSTAAGKRIASLCGERIARCTLELGGKSAAVILDDYDIGLAARKIADNATVLAGQVCSSLTRIIVSRHRHDAMVDALAASFGEKRVGDPFALDSEMGPLAMERQRDRVESYIAKGKAEGARLATGGRRPSHLNRGYFIEPTVFGAVDNAMTIAREEIFGPVLSVIPATDEGEAINIANDTLYGLNNSVFTSDPERAWHAARALRSGTVGHNSMRSGMPISFGGFKQSGIGREGGREGLYPFLENKTVILDALPAIPGIS